MDILFVFLRHSLVYPEYPGICHADLANLKTSAKTSCWPYFSFLLSHPVLILLYQSIRFLSAWFIRTNFWKSFWTLHLLLLVNILSFLGQGLMCPRLVLNSFLYSLEFLIILTPWFISSLFSALPHPPLSLFSIPSQSIFSWVCVSLWIPQCLYRDERKTWESQFSLFTIFSLNWTQVVSLGGKPSLLP